MPYWKTSGLLGRYGMWVVAMAPISQREKISAERVLRSGDELRVGKSRLIFWEVKGDRRVRLANEAIRRGAVTLTMLRDNGTHDE